MFLLEQKLAAWLMANDHDGRQPSSKLPLLQKHSEQPHPEPYKNQQTNKTINQTHAL
jgi:hypothetical protein